MITFQQAAQWIKPVHMVYKMILELCSLRKLMKAYLVKQISGTPISRTAPIIFAERITDFISLVVIALIGAYVYDYGRSIVLAVRLFFLIVIILISNKKIALT